MNGLFPQINEMLTWNAKITVKKRTSYLGLSLL